MIRRAPARRVRRAVPALAGMFLAKLGKIKKFKIQNDQIIHWPAATTHSG
jgi:hypothetical protein